jgi:hypothetical protein
MTSLDIPSYEEAHDEKSDLSKVAREKLRATERYTIYSYDYIGQCT